MRVFVRHHNHFGPLHIVVLVKPTEPRAEGFSGVEQTGAYCIGDDQVEEGIQLNLLNIHRVEKCQGPKDRHDTRMCVQPREDQLDLVVIL